MLGVETLADVDDNRMRRHDLRQLLCRGVATAKDGTASTTMIRILAAPDMIGRNLNTLRNDLTPGSSFSLQRLAVQQVRHSSCR